jgi:hypothetical protein
MSPLFLLVVGMGGGDAARAGADKFGKSINPWYKGQSKQLPIHNP